MKNKTIAIVVLSMEMLSVILGLVFHALIMAKDENLFLHCILLGILFGLFNSFIALFFINRYSDLKIKNLKLTGQVRKDKLTGLNNRGAFENDLKKLDINKRYSVIFIDIDNFKDFNNIYGHQVGDMILHDCATVVKNNIRNLDVAYRYGGDEFVVILNCCKEEANAVAQRILNGMHINTNTTYPPVTLSAGVASMPEDAQAIDQLVKASDLALLKAKVKGKNQVEIFSQIS